MFFDKLYTCDHLLYFIDKYNIYYDHNFIDKILLVIIYFINKTLLVIIHFSYHKFKNTYVNI